MTRTAASLARIVTLAALAAPGLGQCLEWADEFGVPGSDWRVRGSVAFDDGSGPALYACGLFKRIDGTQINKTARWDGTSWTEVGGGIGGYTVRAMEVFDDGNGPRLYAAGRFPNVLDNIAVFNGVNWKKLSTQQPNEAIHAMVVHDDGSGPALYVGGAFTQVGLFSAKRIARWDGNVWTSVDNGFTNDVDALEVFDAGNGPELYAAGKFNKTVNGTTVNHLARWDGTTWHPVASGTDLDIKALKTWDDGTGPALYVAGEFDSAIGIGTVGKIARWDGTAWTKLGTGLNDRVLALEVFDDGTGEVLVAGGEFSTAGGVTAIGTAAWDGTSWSKAANVAGAVHTLTAYDVGGGPELFVGGEYAVAENTVTNNLGSWNGSDWTHYGSGVGLSERIHALQRFDDGTGLALYASGMFDHAGSDVVNHIARWTGSDWEPLAGGLSNRAIDLTVYDDGDTGPALVAGGGFTTAGGVPATRVASWKEGQWTAMGAGMDDTVFAVHVLKKDGVETLFAGGLFTSPGNHIAQWNGVQWSSVGGGTDGPVNALYEWDDGTGTALYVGGFFTQAGGAPAAAIARWDGTSWSPLGAGLTVATTGVQVDAMVAHDDGSGEALYAAGAFTMAGGVTAHRIARWDGSAWSPVGVTGLDSRALALGVFDDGLGGEVLFAGGKFRFADGVPADFIARWDGTTWSGVSGGMSGEVTDLLMFQQSGWPELWVGGAFGYAGGQFNTGGVLSQNVARYSNACACQGASFCAAGTSASGCAASISASGDASRSGGSFQITVSGVEGAKNGLLYFGTSGEQASPWGNGTSLQCVVPPVQRTGTQFAGGSAGACDGSFSLDFNAWMSSNPQNAPQPGDTAYMQAWFRDPQSTSNQTTSLSDGLRFGVCP